MNILPPQSGLEFVRYLLNHDTPHTNLVICQNRKDFVDGLYGACSLRANDFEDHENVEEEMRALAITAHDSIESIAVSRHIKVTFTPTVSHLRAHLSVICKSTFLSNFRANVGSIPSSRLAVFGLISVHRGTSDFSAQGLMRSLSLLLETAQSTEQGVVLAEDLLVDVTRSSHQNDLREAISNPWKEIIPLLSSRVLRKTLNVRTPATQDITIEDVLQNWCQILPSAAITSHRLT